MKHILLTISLIFSATAVSADIPTPNEIITKGKILNKAEYGSSQTNVLYWVAYIGEIWRCSLYTSSQRKPFVNAACVIADQRTSLDP